MLPQHVVIRFDMRARVSISELIGRFRSGLVALIPIAERAGIAWRDQTYDPWEDIEEVLFTSFVSGAVIDAVINVATAAPQPLPVYGFALQSYAGCSFVSERTHRLRGKILAFEALTTTSEPFDTSRFRVIDGDFASTGQSIEIPLVEAVFELAANFGARVEYQEIIDD